MLKSETFQKLLKLTDVLTVVDVAAIGALNSAMKIKKSDLEDGGSRTDRVVRKFASVAEGSIARGNRAMAILLACADYENGIAFDGVGAVVTRPFEEIVREALGIAFSDTFAQDVADVDQKVGDAIPAKVETEEESVDRLVREALAPFAKAADELRNRDGLIEGFGIDVCDDADSEVWRRVNACFTVSDIGGAWAYVNSGSTSRDLMTIAIRPFVFAARKLCDYQELREPIDVAVKSEVGGRPLTVLTTSLTSSHLYRALYVAENILKDGFYQDADDVSGHGM